MLQEGTSSEMPQDSHSGRLPPIVKDVPWSLHPLSQNHSDRDTAKAYTFFSGEPCSTFVCFISWYSWGEFGNLRGPPFGADRRHGVHSHVRHCSALEPLEV